MDRYTNPDAYVMHELKLAHDRIEQLENQINEVVKKLRNAECQLTNQNEYIIELEEKLGITGDV